MINTDNLEHLVIAGLIQYPELITELELKSEMFNDIYAKRFIQYIEKNDAFDMNELYMQSKKHEADFIPSEMILTLRKDNYIKKSHFKQYQLNVLDVYKKRKIAEISSIASNDPSQQNISLLKETIDYLDSIMITNKNHKADALKTIVSEVNLETKPNLLKTGYSQLDNILGGFEAGNFVIVGARPSLGKTAFALNLAVNLEQSGCNIAIYSLETTLKQIYQRIISSVARVKLEKFKFPESITDDESEKIFNAISRIEQMNMYISQETMVTPMTIRRQAMRMQQQSDKNVIIIDFLSLMTCENKHQSRRLEIEEISRKLKIIAKEFDCVIIALSQLSRGVESRSDKRPLMSDLRESGSIEQDADTVILLYREDYQNNSEVSPSEIGKSEIECIIAKNKTSGTGTAYLDYYRPIQRIYDKRHINY